MAKLRDKVRANVRARPARGQPLKLRDFFPNLNKEKPAQPLGKELDKLKIPLTLFKGMEVKPTVHALVQAKANLWAYKTGAPMKTVRGTRIVEVSPD